MKFLTFLGWSFRKHEPPGFGSIRFLCVEIWKVSQVLDDPIERHNGCSMKVESAAYRDLKEETKENITEIFTSCASFNTHPVRTNIPSTHIYIYPLSFQPLSLLDNLHIF